MTEQLKQFRVKTQDERAKILTALALNTDMQRAKFVYLQYHGKTLGLLEFCSYFDIDPVYAMAYYDSVGGDMSDLLRDYGRPVIEIAGRVYDKEEYGNRYGIPWSLVDKHLKDYPMYMRIISEYAKAFPFKWGKLADKEIASGSEAFLKVKNGKRTMADVYQEIIQKIERSMKVVDDALTRRIYGTGLGSQATSVAKAGQMKTKRAIELDYEE